MGTPNLRLAAARRMSQTPAIAAPPPVQAPLIAATVGRALALGFGFLGLFSNPFLVFIALFVWIGAAQESSMAPAATSSTGQPV